MLINEGSSAYIIFFDTLKKMDIEESKMEFFQTSLVGFNRQQITMLTRVQLPVTTNIETKLVNFVVIDTPLSYNVILRRPWLHSLRRLSFSYHKNWSSPIHGELTRFWANKECCKAVTPQPLKVPVQKSSDYRTSSRQKNQGEMWRSFKKSKSTSQGWEGALDRNET